MNAPVYVDDEDLDVVLGQCLADGDAHTRELAGNGLTLRTSYYVRPNGELAL